MKRFTVITLALVMSLTMLTACSSSEEDAGDIDEVPTEYREENGPEEEGSGTEEPTDTDGDSDDDLNSKVNMTGPEQMPDDEDEESATEE